MILPDLTTTLENIHLQKGATNNYNSAIDLKLNLEGEIVEVSKSFLRFMSMDKNMIEGQELSKITLMKSKEVCSLIERVDKGSIVTSEIVFQSAAFKKYVNCIFMPNTTDDKENSVDLQLSF